MPVNNIQETIRQIRNVYSQSSEIENAFLAGVRQYFESSSFLFNPGEKNEFKTENINKTETNIEWKQLLK